MRVTTCLFVAALLGTALPVRAQPVPASPREAVSQPAQKPSRIRVAIAGSAPFVFQGGTQLRGFSVEVWTVLARRLGLEFEFVPMEGVPSALDAVRARQVDLAVGPISITAERLEQMEFTHRYFEASLGILAPRAISRPLDWLQPFASEAFLFGVVLLLSVLLLVGVLMWLAERRANPQQFPEHPVRGIANGVWMALVTMTTVGYGDRVPITLAGRVLTGIWMLVAMLTASSLTAGIATVLTLQHLKTSTLTTADQLRGRRVAAVPGTTSERFAMDALARVVAAPTVERAIQQVVDGEADAVVYDRPILQYWLRENPAAELTLSESSYEPQSYGFALPLGSTLSHRLNVALQEARETGRLEAIRRKWLGGE
jgi:polar amino acid transport system substrate-binding protein